MVDNGSKAIAYELIDAVDVPSSVEQGLVNDATTRCASQKSELLKDSSALVAIATIITADKAKLLHDETSRDLLRTKMDERRDSRNDSKTVLDNAESTLADGRRLNSRVIKRFLKRHKMKHWTQKRRKLFVPAVKLLTDMISSPGALSRQIRCDNTGLSPRCHTVGPSLDRLVAVGAVIMSGGNNELTWELSPEFIAELVVKPVPPPKEPVVYSSGSDSSQNSSGSDSSDDGSSSDSSSEGSSSDSSRSSDDEESDDDQE